MGEGRSDCAVFGLAAAGRRLRHGAALVREGGGMLVAFEFLWR